MVSLANLSFDNFHYPRVNFVNQFVSYLKNILAGFIDLVLHIFCNVYIGKGYRALEGLDVGINE
jgi:hypothetical protein